MCLMILLILIYESKKFIIFANNKCELCDKNHDMYIKDVMYEN